MSGESCSICDDDVTNEKTYYVCAECWAARHKRGTQTFEDLCLLVEQDGGRPVFMQGHLTREQRDAITAAKSDEYKCGWNDRSMYEYEREKALINQAQSGLSDDVRCLLASGACFWHSGKISLNMNDTWSWACSDIPEVPDEHVKEVARLFKTYGFAGMMYWCTLQPDGPKRSEFADNNRAIEFVRREEAIRKEFPGSSQRAYHKVKYTIGEEP